MVGTALLRLAGLIMGIGSKAPTEYGFQSAADSVRDSSTHNQVHYKQTNKQTNFKIPCSGPSCGGWAACLLDHMVKVVRWV